MQTLNKKVVKSRGGTIEKVLNKLKTVDGGGKQPGEMFDVVGVFADVPAFFFGMETEDPEDLILQ